MKKNIAVKLTSVIALLLAPQQLWAVADITTNTEINTVLIEQQRFSTNSDTVLTISGDGDVNVLGGSSSIIANRSDSLSNLAIVVDTNSSSKGIKSSDGSAIDIGGNNSISTISLDAGIITSNSDLGNTIFLAGTGGSTAISAAFGTTISQTGIASSTIYSSTTSNTDLSITNAGKISVQSNANSGTIYFGDSDGGSTLTVDNAGTIHAGIGKALEMADSGNSATVNNTSFIVGSLSAGANSLSVVNNTTTEITGNISATTGFLSIINTAGTITGNIDMGSNSSSILRLNGGSIVGNITLGSTNGVGMIWRNGTSVSGTIQGSGAGSGQISIGFLGAGTAETVTASANIGGGGKAIGSLTLQSLNTFNLGAHSLTTTGGVYLNRNTTLNVGNGTVTSDILGFIPFSLSSNGAGTVNFTENNNLAGNVGTHNGRSLNTVNISAGKNVDAGIYRINAQNINLAANSSLTIANVVSGGGDNTTGANLTDAAIILSANSTLILNDRSTIIGNINGETDGDGNVTAAGVVSVDEIGATRAIDNFTSAINSDVTFNGNIFANNVVINGDAIFSNSTTTITTDNFTLNSGASLSLVISDPAATSLVVDGSAMISEDTTLQIQLSGVINSGTVITLIDATAPSAISAIADPNVNINFSGSNFYDGNLFSTSVSGNKLLLTARLARLTFNNSNLQNIYDAAQNSSSPSGELSRLKTYLTSSSYSLDQKTAALKSAMPEVDNSSNRVVFNNASTALDISSMRLQSIQKNAQYAYNQKNAIKSDAPSFAIAMQKEARKSAWAQVFGSNINQENSVNSDGYNANSRGIIFGGDKKIDNNFILGISGSYTNSNIKSSNSLKQTNIASYQINTYGGYNFEKYFINSMLGFVLNEYKSNRTIPIFASAATANYSGQNYIARAEFGMNQKFDSGFILTPLATITAAHNNVENYTERGAGTLNLHVKNRGTNFFETRAGIKISNNFSYSKLTIISPEFSTSYGYDFAGDEQKTSSNFVGQSNVFDSSAQNIARGSLKIGVGTKIYSGDALSFNLNYNF